MENVHLDVVNQFVWELHQAGVQHVCVSPGSRSTPFTMAIARLACMQIWTLLDERSAAFFALGLAASTHEPVALVCTSGTATANYVPAVMEAYQSRLPLIVLTADRPPELRGIGSNQTVDQVKLYGDNVKWSAQMPVPDGAAHLSDHARMMAWRAVSTAMTPPYGPVHLNWPFREPLVPPRPDFTHLDAASFDRSWSKGVVVPNENAIARARTLLNSSQYPLVICGPLPDRRIARAVLNFARRIDAPLFADVLSSVRTIIEATDTANVIDTYDLWLTQSCKQVLHKPDLVIRFGGTPTSKLLGIYLSDLRDTRQMIVEQSSMWRDAQWMGTDVFQCDELEFCRAMSEVLQPSKRTEWQHYWRNVQGVAQKQMHSGLAIHRWHEAGVVTSLQAVLARKPQLDVQIFCGNSMPVRDFESFFASGQVRGKVYANRGASGIDGIVSTAFGVAAGSGKRTVLVIGDVSFYHDLNGLLAANRFGIPLLIILINNDGGGIFSFLPQAEYPDTFPYFQTSHGLDFAPIVRAYGGEFTRVTTWPEFEQAVETGLANVQLSVVEVRTESTENVEWHRQIQREVASAVEMMKWKRS